MNVLSVVAQQVFTVQQSMIRNTVQFDFYGILLLEIILYYIILYKL
jgi:hypothetical protein